MKIRTDFVTNSSSSGYVVVSITTRDNNTYQAENEYSAGYGGYFWNNSDLESKLDDAIDSAKNGKDIIEVLRRFIDYFDGFMVESSDARGGKELVSALQNMDTLENLKEIFISEETRFDMGGERGARYTHNIRIHNNQNFYPEEYDEYDKSSEAFFSSMLNKQEAFSKNPEDIAKAIVKRVSNYGVYFLTWLVMAQPEKIGLPKNWQKTMEELAGSGQFAELLRLDTGIFFMLTAKPDAWTEIADACLSALAAEELPSKGREYLKYVIEHMPDKGMALIATYNALLKMDESPLPKLTIEEVNAFRGEPPFAKLSGGDSFEEWNYEENDRDQEDEDQEDFDLEDENEDESDEEEEDAAEAAFYWNERYGSYVENNPEIVINGQKFVLSGCEYDEYLIKMIPEYGGLIRTKISGVTDYLVVDPEIAGESKIESAIQLQKQGKPIKIILMEDLKKALSIAKKPTIEGGSNSLPVNKKPDISPERGPLTGHNCFVLGRLNRMTGSEIKDYIEKRGGTYQLVLRDNTTIFIVGGKSGATENGLYSLKFVSALELRDFGNPILIMTEEEFFSKYDH